MKSVVPQPSPAVVLLAKQLGQRVRAARVRRKLRQEDLATKAGLSRTAIEAVEAGKLTTGLGTYLQALWAMGLTGGINVVADPGLDRDGLALELDAQTMRVHVGGAVDNDF
ncbi:helix-turn-helix domain-containing protein [Roseateles sp. DC23W]|uniref:Helix-turn-helix domain-containing protein n=1 Tax=Pelomonas dachongensis TaxID=3299029 RepID=A0ABW7EXY0_9BURK